MRLVDMLPAPPLYAVGMVSIFVTSKNQRLGDLAAGTLVVRERPGELHGGRHQRRATARAADGWDVSAVSAQDIGTVRRFLGRPRASPTGRASELAEELERRLRPRVAGAPEELRAEEFLERLSAAKSSLRRARAWERVRSCARRR